MTKELNKAILELIPVLEFYGEKENYRFKYPGGPCPALVVQDDGEKAREALKMLERLKNEKLNT